MLNTCHGEIYSKPPCPKPPGCPVSCNRTSGWACWWLRCPSAHMWSLGGLLDPKNAIGNAKKLWGTWLSCIKNPEYCIVFGMNSFTNIMNIQLLSWLSCSVCFFDWKFGVLLCNCAEGLSPLGDDHLGQLCWGDPMLSTVENLSAMDFTRFMGIKVIGLIMVGWCYMFFGF